jgi:hypothetical protein
VVVKKSIWITSPFEKKNKPKEQLLWVCGEEVEVRVMLSNPFAFKIQIDSIELRYNISKIYRCTVVQRI